MTEKFPILVFPEQDQIESQRYYIEQLEKMVNQKGIDLFNAYEEIAYLKNLVKSQTYTIKEMEFEIEDLSASVEQEFLSD